MWCESAAHTTPGIPEHKEPEVALLTAGIELDVLGLDYEAIPDATREQILAAHPRVDFKRQIIPAFADGIATSHTPPSATSRPTSSHAQLRTTSDFCDLILGSRFAA